MRTLNILAPKIFDCEKIFRSFCEAIGCEGGHNLIEFWFNQWYGKLIFYFVSRKDLEKWLSCKVNENRKICGFCEDVRLAHGFSILECVLMMVIILNHVRCTFPTNLLESLFFNCKFFKKN